MKNLVLLGLMVLLGLPMAAFAAPVGGPPEQGVNLSIEGDYTNVRAFEPSAIRTDEEDVVPNGGIGCKIRHMYRTMLNINYGFLDYFAIYIKLGGVDYKFRADIEDQDGSPVGNAKINTRWGFVFGGGLKGAYEFKDGSVKGLVVGGDVQYLRQRQKYRARLTEFGVEERIKGKATLQEWHFGPFVGYKFMNFFPYIGMKYSDARLKFKGDMEIKFKAKDNVGAYVGLTYDLIPQLKLNLEGRFFDEYGVNFNVSYKFF